MTREEAIKILSNESYIGNSKLDDAIAYAIEALSEPIMTIKTDGHSLTEVAEVLKRHGLMAVDDSKPTPTEMTKEEIEREEIERELIVADMVLGVIENVKMPMLMYDGEKEVVKKALTEYKYKLEREMQGGKE